MAESMADLEKKRILILSDNDGLSKAIELNLRSHLEVDIVRLVASNARKRNDGWKKFDLMVVAVSSANSEPVVALARFSLTEYVGKVPLLIISDRPFDTEPEDHIVHLDFPFDLNRLYDTVKKILQVPESIWQSH